MSRCVRARAAGAGRCRVGRGREEERAPATVVGDNSARTVISRNASPDVPSRAVAQSVRKGASTPVSTASRGLPTRISGCRRGWISRRGCSGRRTRRSCWIGSFGRRIMFASLGDGANTDPYQPIERTERITRAVLEVCRDFNQPVGLITKSALVTRDLDILGPMAERGLAAVAVSVTTLDRGLARRMEPRASTPVRRLNAVRELTEAGSAGFGAGESHDPCPERPRVGSDSGGGAEAGAGGEPAISCCGCRWRSKSCSRNAAGACAGPGRPGVEPNWQARAGGLYQAEFGTRMTGTGPIAELLSRRFKLACRRLGLNGRRWDLDCGQFRGRRRGRGIS